MCKNPIPINMGKYINTKKNAVFGSIVCPFNYDFSRSTIIKNTAQSI